MIDALALLAPRALELVGHGGRLFVVDVLVLLHLEVQHVLPAFRKHVGGFEESDVVCREFAFFETRHQARVVHVSIGHKIRDHGTRLVHVQRNEATETPVTHDLVAHGFLHRPIVDAAFQLGHARVVDVLDFQTDVIRHVVAYHGSFVRLLEKHGRSVLSLQLVSN